MEHPSKSSILKENSNTYSKKNVALLNNRLPPLSEAEPAVPAEIAHAEMHPRTPKFNLTIALFGIPEQCR